MIKATANNGEVLLFGLSELNIQKLKEGKPIFIDTGQMGFGPHIYIFYGDTEMAMERELREQGLITEQTIYRPAGPLTRG